MLSDAVLFMGIGLFPLPHIVVHPVGFVDAGDVVLAHAAAEGYEVVAINDLTSPKMLSLLLSERWVRSTAMMSVSFMGRSSESCGCVGS